MRTAGLPHGRALARLSAATVLALVGATLPSAATAQTEEQDPLYLVTLDGPGTAGYRGFLPSVVVHQQAVGQQTRLLSAIGADAPVYSWTTALNGFAVRLDEQQARDLVAEPEVALVEKNDVRPLTAAPALPEGTGVSGPDEGGDGVVIGVVDSGISPESPLFAGTARLGEAAPDFRGGCSVGAEWGPATCNDKILGARWFVDGFGEKQLRATSVLSARDTTGHGTQMASIAAGNAGVSVSVRGEQVGRYGGLAPQSRLAIYKACWGAPDPRDDGCATADLVSAIDRATADGVDVLNLSVGGPTTFDTVERALLGAAEADIVVAGAAGNDRDRSYAAHPGPWVTTVGGTHGTQPRGEVAADGGPSVSGAMVSDRTVGPAPVVIGSEAPARGATREAARTCTPGSLDAGAVGGAVVLCERGGVGRIDKSRAVSLADGVGMVLVNESKGSLDSDFHSVPTVHVTAEAGGRLSQWAARESEPVVTLSPDGVSRRRAGVVSWSSAGDPTASVLKPDVVGPATGILGATPVGPDGWDFVSGTSAATAYTSGAAATLISERPNWSASQIRSALTTTAGPISGASLLESGTGRVRGDLADRPGLALTVEPGDYRAWLEGDLATLNTPSIALTDGRARATRTITNVGARARYFSSQARGFGGAVQVTPAAVTLDPGESATFTVRTATGGGSAATGSGYVVWRGATGSLTRIPVFVAR